MRRGLGTLVALTLGWALIAGVSTAAADTTVSITFDDGNADQMPAVQMLTDHGMHGTFYIIPGRVDRPNSQYMSWANVQTIFDAGNEIGGHTQNHLHLPDLSASQQQSEICGGRDSLLAKGYPQISFAYPFGDHDSTSEGLVQQCGYESGRGVGGLRGDGEPDADTIPPRNPWVLPTPGSIDVDDTLADVKQWITDAEAAGASQPDWIILVFHHLCDPDVSDCSDPNGVDDAYMSPQDFDALLDWLQPRALTGTHVKTVEEVMTGQAPQDTTPPTSSIKCDGAVCQGAFYNHSVSATLSATDNSGGSGVKNIRYTTNGTNPTASSPVYSSAIPVSATTTIKWRAEDNAGNVESIHTQTISIDATNPSSSAIQCNGAACQSGFYNASVSATFSGSDSGGSGLNGIRYTTDGSTPNGSSSLYVPGTSSPVSVGSTTTVKFRAQDKAGNLESTTHTQAISIDTAKPTSSIQCDGAACLATYNHSVNATLLGSDTGGSGLKNIRFTTDGSNPTSSSTVYSGAIPLSSTTTIKWRAEDNAGNIESPIHTQAITIDTANPASSIQCNGAACSSGFYNASVSATLSGSDTGGSGLKNIRFTTNGSDPTGSSTIYTAPISVGSTATIKWRAEDNAGNIESPIHTQAISIDTAKPTSSIICDGAACETSYDHAIEATLSGGDTGGSGLQGIRYTTDGSTPTSSSALYGGPIAVEETTTISFRAEDNAGNLEPAHSQSIAITSGPPPPPGDETPGGIGGTLGSLFSFSSLPNGTVKLVLDVTGPGHLQAMDGILAGTSAAAAKKRKARIKPTAKSVAQGGEVTLVIRTTKAGKRILRRRGRLSVPVRVTFTPVTGSPTELTIELKFRINLST